MDNTIIKIILLFSWKRVNEDDATEFKKSLSPPVYTNSSQTNYTLTGLQPYTVYNFQVLYLDAQLLYNLCVAGCP